MNHTVYVWNPLTGKCHVVAQLDHQATALAVLEDGNFAIGSADGTVRVWDPNTEHSQLVSQHNDGSVTCLASLKGGQVASGGSDGTVRVWNPTTQQSQVAIQHDGPVTMMAVNKDGHLVSAG